MLWRNSRLAINCSSLESFFQQCDGLNLFNQIFSQLIFTGLFKDTYAASKVLRFVTDSTFVPIDYSLKIFHSIDNPNGFIWNTMFRAFLREGIPRESISMYRNLLGTDSGAWFIDNYTLPVLIQGCALGSAYFEGAELHDHVVKLGFGSDVYVVNNLINMYGACRLPALARKVFDQSPVLDSVSWNSMLAGYVSNGNVDEAKSFYAAMPVKNVIASNSMIALLGKVNQMNEAYRLFIELKEKDLVSWTAMISGYEQNEMYESALKLFLIFLSEAKITVDEVIIITVLSAASHLQSLPTGMAVHGFVSKLGLESHVNLLNALIHMYSKCGVVSSAEKLFRSCSGCLDLISWNSMISGYIKNGSADDARKLFDEMPQRDVYSWGSMISGYSQLGFFSHALQLFRDMQRRGVVPDETTLVSVVSSCTELSAFDQGRWVDAFIRKNKMKVNPILGTSLINMYAKCGSLECAVEVFDRMEDGERGASSWNALILGFATNGQVERSLETFERMKRSAGVVPNDVTFVAVLGACRHVGSVEEGRRHFDSMGSFGVEPNVKHYGCLIDLLARRGLLQEAEDLIDSMPMEPDVATWGALLGACKKHGDEERGERIGRKLVRLQPEHDGFHVLLSNIYASKGRWSDVFEIRGFMTRRGVVKTPGCSVIEANGEVHEFLAGDRSHPKIEEIEGMLEEVIRRAKRRGYAPGTHEVLLDIDEEGEGDANLIVKNLRICTDCHTVAKIVSEAFDREIVIRDRRVFHHFHRGSCSCNDYW
ncbi:hypothetical protein M569_01119 [Genlisea aurea]|uniref:DYW domain-containing protein n=1 Tax=Genlisea aurea TaxID=192259 RepID=S8D817_9LAMI|nr:hypothetical protein M569_01119 [Genlisea aurea]